MTLVAPKGNWSAIVNIEETSSFTCCYEIRINKEKGILAHTKGECFGFWYQWMIHHDRHYLLLPFVPGCQILLDCQTGDRKFLLDAETSDSPPFRWLSVEKHPSGDPIFAVVGRYDASPCQIKIVDFRDMTKPKTLRLFDDWFSSFNGWTSTNTLQTTKNFEVRTSDLKKLDDMTIDELKELEERKEQTHDVDEHFELDVAEEMLPNWNSNNPHPIVFKVD